MSTATRLFAGLRLCFGLLLVALCSTTWAAEGPVAQKAARFLLADDETPPSASRAWVNQSLPDNWSASRQGAQGTGWYRMAFEHSGRAEERVAVLVRRLSMNGEIFINGERVLSGGRMTTPVTRNWNTPFYVELPPGLLRVGTNVLDVRLFAYRNSNGGLGTVFLGDPGTLQVQHRFLQALHVKGAIVSFAVALLAAFIAGVAWLRMHHDAIYGWFALAMLAWVLRYTNYFVQDVPIDPVAYAVVVNSAQGWFFIFFTPFLLRLSRVHWPRIELALLASGVLGTAVIAAAFQGWLPLWSVIASWLVVWIPGSVVLLWLSTRNARRSRSVLASLAALVAWLYVPLTVRELLITANQVAFDTSYIAHYVGIPLVVLIAWMLIDRVVSAARAAAAAEIARAQAAFNERLRITQDMHDGLGLQLNAALRRVERGTLDAAGYTATLRTCVDELRLIVDSSASGTGEFLSLLAGLRHRWQAKLEAIGLHTRWQMDQFPDTLRLPPAMSLQLLRMVQEAINNTIQHAGANLLVFEALASTRPGHIALVVRDNGAGFEVGAATDGTGLRGLRRRAAALGVGLNIHTSPAGTAVVIDIPLQAAHPLLPAHAERQP